MANKNFQWLLPFEDPAPNAPAKVEMQMLEPTLSPSVHEY